MNDADIETLELAERAREIDHARRKGYCIGCDLTAEPGTIRVWHPATGGHTTDEHSGCGPIGDLGLCATCEADYLKGDDQ